MPTAERHRLRRFRWQGQAHYTLAGLGSNTQWTILTATAPIVDNGIKAVPRRWLSRRHLSRGHTDDLKLLGVDFNVTASTATRQPSLQTSTTFTTGNLAG
jgi:hypothetical protein